MSTIYFTIFRMMPEGIFTFLFRLMPEGLFIVSKEARGLIYFLKEGVLRRGTTTTPTTTDGRRSKRGMTSASFWGDFGLIWVSFREGFGVILE